jgi:hypothetical protein
MVTRKDLIKTGLFFKYNLSKNISEMAGDQNNRRETVGNFTSQSRRQQTWGLQILLTARE